MALLLASPTTALGHGYLSEPAARSVGMPNEDYQFCFGTPECVCGEYAEPGPIVAVYEGGQTIEVTVEVTLAHDTGNLFRFQLCPPDDQTLGCFEAGEFAVRDYDMLAGTYTYQLELPDGVVCDPCVLRWKWDYGFLSCADVRIVPAGTPIGNPGWSTLKSTWR
jgi:hypothetical protein